MHHSKAEYVREHQILVQNSRHLCKEVNVKGSQTRQTDGGCKVTVPHMNFDVIFFCLHELQYHFRHLH